MFRDCSSRCIRVRRPSVRPSVCVWAAGGRLTGRGDRIRQKLFPVRTHVHRPRRKPQRRGLNRAPHSRAIHTSSVYLSLSSLCSLINRWTVLTSSQPTTMQFSRRFISLFGVDHGPATSCLHSPPACLSFPPPSAKRIYLFRGGGRENQRDNFVGQTEKRGKGWREVLTTGGRVGGWHCTWTPEIGDE